MNIRTILILMLLASIVCAQNAPDPNNPDNQFYENAISTLDDATSESNTWSVRSTLGNAGAVAGQVGGFFASSVIGDEFGCAPPPTRARIPDISNNISSFLSTSITILFGVVSVAALLAALVYALGQAFGAETRARAITLASSLLVSSTVVLVLFFIVYNVYPILLSELGGTPENFNMDVSLLAPVVMIAIGVFAVAGALYVIGNFLQIPSITAAAKDELFASVVTFIRVLFIGLSMMAAGGVFYSLAAVPGGEMDPVYASALSDRGGIDYIDASINISLNVLKEVVRNYGFMLISNTILHAMYTSTLFFGLTWRAMYSFSLGPVFKPLVDVLGQMMQFMQIAIAEWIVHAATLCAIKKWSWQLFIPFGMLLRAIPQTRGGGDALLALIFAFLIIYPLMFIVDYEIHKMLRGIIVDPGDLVGAFVQSGGLGGIVATVGIMVFLTASVFMPLFAGAAINLILELTRNAIYYIVIMSFLLPFINIFVTLTFAREQAKFFNVDVNFMAFARLI